jgi:hypothetical protein
MIITIDKFTKRILDNLQPTMLILLAMARMEETQKPTLSAISSRLDAEIAAEITEHSDNIKLKFLEIN